MTSSRRSAFHFIVFFIIAIGMTLFVLGKAQEAINEIDQLNQSYVSVLRD